MSEDRYLELAPLAALGVLDGEDRSGFQAHLPGCMVCKAELSAHESVAALIPLALIPVQPSRGIRERLVTGGDAPAVARAQPSLPLSLSLAAAAALAVGLLVVRAQRDTALSEAAQARLEAAAAKEDARQSAEALVKTRGDLGEAVAFRALFARPESRVATLAGQKPAPGARARVLFDPKTREAVLIASGLEPVPAGKAYEAWVIASGAPVAAGVFRPDAEGRALLRLPALDVTAQVKTFAVTLEPEAGTPAPSGPMILAGTVS